MDRWRIIFPQMTEELDIVENGYDAKFPGNNVPVPLRCPSERLERTSTEVGARIKATIRQSREP